jgi:ankyrin repeat protein
VKRLLVVWLVSALGWAGPVHEAASRGDAEGLRRLSGAALDAPDEKGLTALVLAIQNGHPECVELLLQMGANPNAGPWTALHEAALMGDAASVRALLQRKADPNRREKQNQGTPVHVACFQGHLDICRVLLRAGAQVNLRDGEGLTPLFHAKDQGHGELVKLLKASGGR